MQLDATPRPSPARSRLRAAACLLLASAIPARARADSGSTMTLEASGLLYGEKDRANVVEPAVRVTRLRGNGQSFSAGLALDAITGASPSGAMPTGRVMTTTSASGTTTTHAPGEIPTVSFKDFRGALDLGWSQPLGAIAGTDFTTHYSREKDYQSMGGTAKLSLDLMQKLTNVTLGGGFDYDNVFPVGGTRAELTDAGIAAGGGSGAPDDGVSSGARAGLAEGPVIVSTNTNIKRVASGVVGLSRVLTRRWMVAVNASRIVQRGYLTEPYKIVSVIDPDSGTTVGALTEQRPSTRDRKDFLANSVYHLERGVFYSSYRYYWDDWGVRSHTVDLKYRRELAEQTFFQPHVRFYTQTAADFFRFGLVQGEPLPAYATSDFRLGPLHSVTLGGTYGFQVPDQPGEFTVRVEYMLQWGDGHPPDAVGVQQQLDLMPPLHIGTVMVGYTVNF
jgi:hypothetical protein